MRNSAIGKVIGISVLLTRSCCLAGSGFPADSADTVKHQTVGDKLSKLARNTFLKYNLNKITKPDSLAMTGFYQALDSLQNGTRQKVNVVHIGDSHIQADIFSGRMRSLLQDSDAFGNGGRGFVFPYPLARTNNPWNYKVTSTGLWSGCRNVQYAKIATGAWPASQPKPSDSSATFSVQTLTSFNSVPVSKVRVFYPGKGSDPVFEVFGRRQPIQFIDL